MNAGADEFQGDGMNAQLKAELQEIVKNAQTMPEVEAAQRLLDKFDDAHVIPHPRTSDIRGWGKGVDTDEAEAAEYVNG